LDNFIRQKINESTLAPSVSYRHLEVSLTLGSSMENLHMAMELVDFFISMLLLVLVLKKTIIHMYAQHMTWILLLISKFEP
jgi:hypothetical protein